MPAQIQQFLSQNANSSEGAPLRSRRFEAQLRYGIGENLRAPPEVSSLIPIIPHASFRHGVENPPRNC